MPSLRSLLFPQIPVSGDAPPVSGPDLRAERRAAEVTVIAVAKRMKLSRQSVHTLEGSHEVPPQRVAQYRAALQDVIATSEGVS
jgi:hypothetical protein